MGEEKWHRHVGVYGICLNEERDRLLVIRKTAGPYAGRYDLPGGGMQAGESLTDAAVREFREETGFSVRVRRNLGTFDFLVRWPFKDTTHTHHVAVFYEIAVEAVAPASEIQRELQSDKGTELNDSAGIEWMLLAGLNEGNASPLVQKALRYVQGERLSNEMVVHEEWQVLDR